LFSTIILMALAINAHSANELLATDFTVTVGQKIVPAHPAKVVAADPAQRFKAMSDPNPATFASFDLRGRAEVCVTCPETVREAKILPSASGIVPKVEGKRVRFTLGRPQHLTLEINGNWLSSLHLFANPPETDVPRADDPNVMFYSPGVHEVDSVRVPSGKTVYIAEGAVVRATTKSGAPRGSAFLLEGSNITLRGRGIIDGSLCPHRSRHLVSVRGTNIVVEGVILLDSSVWAVPIRRSENVTIKNLKLIGYRANSDGIDICNSRNVEVANCFIRTWDDLVVVKTDKGQGEARHITVHDCVLWNEVAHALSIGAELRENVDDVVFRDCDVIHDKGREWTLRVFHCDSARISNVRFENIRIEETRKFISLWINKAVWTRDAERGHIANITFKNIRATGDNPRIEFKGFDAEHAVTGVTCENVVINGQPLTPDQIKRNDFVRDVRVTP
jgi:polygalacturonase